MKFVENKKSPYTFKSQLAKKTKILLLYSTIRVEMRFSVKSLLM